MKEVRYFYVPDAGTAGELPEQEAQHALKVLRLKEGDDMVLMDGNGVFFQAKVTVASKKHCLYTIVSQEPQQKSPGGAVFIWP